MPDEAFVPDLLTAEEHAALAVTADLWDRLCRIVGDGASRDADLSELAGHVHGIQHAIMAQAAARAYPERIRLLGGRVSPPPQG